MDAAGLEAPPLFLDEPTRRAFRRAWRAMRAYAAGTAAAPNGWPLHDWLRWLVRAEPVVLHGSNNGAIDTFVPRWQMDYQARFRKGIWATADGIWPLFFAIVDRRGYEGTLRNGCWWEEAPGGGRRKLYRFSLNAAMLRRGCWTTGTVYILPRGPFQQAIGEDGEPLEEWVSERPVRPLARIRVRPSDFPFLDLVQGHEDPPAVRDSPGIPPPEWPVVAVEPGALERLAGVYAVDPEMAFVVSRIDGHLGLAATTGFLKTDLWPVAEGRFVSRELDLQVVFRPDGLVLRLFGRETPFPKAP